MQTTRIKKTPKARVTRTPSTGARHPFTYLTYLRRLMALETGKTVQFEIAVDPGSKVYVAGTFNGWNPNTHPLYHHPEDGVFRAALLLPAGTYEYKFVVNGDWKADEKCPYCVPSAPGGLNSVLQV